jgi:hypothetical protein
MIATQLRQLLRDQPFRPFRLVMSDGTKHAVAGPEWMLVTSATTAIGIPGESGDGEVVAILANEHITSTEYTDAAARK